jgi:hypothetical protein
MMRCARLAVGCAAVLGLTTVALSDSVADVDPASDVLVVQDVFLPYQPPVCGQVKDSLLKATHEARAAGYPIKVAIIGSTIDLGAAPEFFGRPMDYAKFLGSELGVVSRHANQRVKDLHLLVVMPAGPALFHANRAASDALAGTEISQDADSNALARTAITAVPKAATAAGHSVAAVKIPAGCSHKGSSSTLLFLVPLILLALAGLAIRLGRPGEKQPQ